MASAQAGPGGPGGPMWHPSLLPRIRQQMTELGFVSPLLWLTKGNCEDVCKEKLEDLINFAPTQWDGLLCSLVIIARGVLMGTAVYSKTLAALDACQAFAISSSTPSFPGGPVECELMRRYRRVVKHLIDSTALVAACLHRGCALAEVHATAGIELLGVNNMTSQECSALAAAQSLTLQICHYALWPSLMDERKPLFSAAVMAAAHALSLNSKEGEWYTLYARCLPWSSPDKGLLLEAGLRLGRSPFTLFSYVEFLTRSNVVEAVALAANLVKGALCDWPSSVFVNSNYVTLFLASNCRSYLDLATAKECLERARDLAPDSPLLAGQLWSLRDVANTGVQLSPILAEHDIEVGRWSPDKEARLRNLASLLYSSARRNLNYDEAQPVPSAHVDRPVLQTQPIQVTEQGGNSPPPEVQEPVQLRQNAQLIESDCDKVQQGVSVSADSLDARPAKGTLSLWSPTLIKEVSRKNRVVLDSVRAARSLNMDTPKPPDVPRTQFRPLAPLRRPLTASQRGQPGQPPQTPAPSCQGLTMAPSSAFSGVSVPPSPPSSPEGTSPAPSSTSVFTRVPETPMAAPPMTTPPPTPSPPREVAEMSVGVRLPIRRPQAQDRLVRIALAAVQAQPPPRLHAPVGPQAAGASAERVAPSVTSTSALAPGAKPPRLAAKFAYLPPPQTIQLSAPSRAPSPASDPAPVRRQIPVMRASQTSRDTGLVPAPAQLPEKYPSPALADYGRASPLSARSCSPATIGAPRAPSSEPSVAPTSVRAPDLLPAASARLHGPASAPAPAPVPDKLQPSEMRISSAPMKITGRVSRSEVAFSGSLRPESRNWRCGSPGPGSRSQSPAAASKLDVDVPLWRKPTRYAGTGPLPAQKKVNCVCTSFCALQTFRDYGTLRPAKSAPNFCAKAL